MIKVNKLSMRCRQLWGCESSRIVYDLVEAVKTRQEFNAMCIFGKNKIENVQIQGLEENKLKYLAMPNSYNHMCIIAQVKGTYGSAFSLLCLSLAYE